MDSNWFWSWASACFIAAFGAIYIYILAKIVITTYFNAKWQYQNALFDELSTNTTLQPQDGEE